MHLTIDWDKKLKMIWQMLANVLKALPGEASHKVTVAALSKGIYPRYSPIQIPTEIGLFDFLIQSD